MHLTLRYRARLGLILILAMTAGQGSLAQDPAPTLTSDQAQALDQISANSLRGHLSFLASDLLEGRDTPSKGQDIAAEYIAAQFRRAGLEAVGDDGYFQTANWEISEPDTPSFRFEIQVAGGAEPIRPDLAHLALASARALDFRNVGVVKVDFTNLETQKTEAIQGKAVLVEIPDSRKLPMLEARVLNTTINAFRRRMTEAKVAFVVNIRRNDQFNTGMPPGRLIDPQAPAQPERANAPNTGTTISVDSPSLTAIFDAMPAGPGTTTLSLHMGEPVKRPVKLRNVVGLLRGSDPVLKETYVMVTAHYDHIGVNGPNGTDRIYNGANDDGSGTVSVVELATSLSSLRQRPKRSLVFMTFFGEEKGLLGSRYYGRHPLFPIEKTVADINLEQVGRTDSSEGPQVASASMTGFGFSDVSTVFAAAGQLEGVRVYRHPQNSDAFFGRSDNQALADLGVPAHTLCVAFEYPDYHGAADHWDKVDYANMAKVDRMVGRALLSIAENPIEPKWDQTNPKATRYFKAWTDRRPR